jgi:2-polyprenyl-3-methyl-5-hydroxy-6-metoxy-1,4-benzoquinol methylase
MLAYWQEHARRFGELDYARDPDGLANVCGPGQPPWLGEHLARSQRRVFAELIARVGRPAPAARALDVGTGAGRWARTLADAGYRTTGIDLQTRLVEDARARFPELEFEAIAVQDFRAEEPFDLVSTVTVLQHVPFAEQRVVAQRLRELLRTGGHAVVLEHVRDQAPHVFSRTADGWDALFRDAGFALVHACPFGYNPALRGYSALRRRLRRPEWSRRDAAELRPEDVVARRPRAPGGGVKGALRRVDRGVMRATVSLDGVLEPVLVARRTRRLAPTDCGLLFRAS